VGREGEICLGKGKERESTPGRKKGKKEASRRNRKGKVRVDTKRPQRAHSWVQKLADISAKEEKNFRGAASIKKKRSEKLGKGGMGMKKLLSGFFYLGRRRGGGKLRP